MYGIKNKIVNMRHACRILNVTPLKFYAILREENFTTLQLYKQRLFILHELLDYAKRDIENKRVKQKDFFKIEIDFVYYESDINSTT